MLFVQKIYRMFTLLKLDCVIFYSCRPYRDRMHYFFLLTFFLLFSLFLFGCGSKSWHRGGVPGSRPYTINGVTYYPLKSAKGFTQEGTASWYGPGFHGRSTASGERYDQYGMTAAHTILPLQSQVRVTNLENGRSVVLRVNDRGPFIRGRVINLSLAAAQRLSIVGKGTAFVRIQSLELDTDNKSSASVHGSFYVQLGVFSDKANADRMLQKLLKNHESARILPEGEGRWNVQAGPWEALDDANDNLWRLRQEFPDSFVVSGKDVS